jgi:hypothetical protein
LKVLVKCCFFVICLTDAPSVTKVCGTLPSKFDPCEAIVGDLRESRIRAKNSAQEFPGTKQFKCIKPSFIIVIFHGDFIATHQKSECMHLLHADLSRYFS